MTTCQETCSKGCINTDQDAPKVSACYRALSISHTCDLCSKDEMLNSVSFGDKHSQFPNVEKLVGASLLTNTVLGDMREDKSGVHIVKTDISVQLLEWSLTANQLLQLYIQIGSGKVHLQWIRSFLPLFCATSPLIYGRRIQTSKEINWTLEIKIWSISFWPKLFSLGTSYQVFVCHHQ